MKYFLVFIFFSLQLNAQTTCNLVNLGASYECLINPKGGFFKQNLIPPDPEPPEVAQAPTKIMLSDIDPNITAGTIIGMRSVGGYSFSPFVGDNAVTATRAIFVDANGRHLRFGARSNVLESFHYITASEVENDFDIKNPTINNMVELEVPAGAVAILVGPVDSPLSDNSDFDGNYEAEIIYPIIKADIYQVVKNPILFAPSTRVDLVAGKNADVVVELGPEIDITGSTIEWLGKSYTCNPGGTNPPDSVHSCTSTVTSTDRTVTFQIDPVPSEASKLGESTMTLTIKTPLPNPPGGFKILGTKELQVTVRKTKPIKLGFARIKSKENNYPLPIETQIGSLITKGVPYIKLMYPVADDDVTWVESFSAINGTDESKETDVDRYSLNKLIDEKISPFGAVTKIVGLVSNEYFDIFHGSFSRRGETKFKERSIIVASGADYPVIAHEIGHTFCIRYDNQFSCENGNNSNAHAPSSDNNILGYSNKTFSELPEKTRGKLFFQTNVMYGQYQQLTSSLQWFDSLEYLTIFKRSLITSSKEVVPLNVTISGSLKQNDEFTKYSSYFSSQALDTSFNNEGNYLAQALDSKENIIFEGRFFSKSDLEDDAASRYVSLVIPYNPNIFSVKISNVSTRGVLGKYILPVDILREKLERLPDIAFSGDAKVTKSNIARKLQFFESALLEKRAKDAMYIIDNELLAIFNKQIKNTFLKGSLLDTDKFDILKSALVSKNIINTAVSSSDPTSVNDFVKISLKEVPNFGSRVGVGLNAIKVPSNLNQLILVEVYFDSQLLCYDIIAKCNNLLSFTLNAGQHTWIVKTFLADKKSWSGYSSSYLSYVNEKKKIEIMIDHEVDPTILNELQEKLSKVKEKINEIQILKMNLKLKIDNDVYLNFEVSND